MLVFSAIWRFTRHWKVCFIKKKEHETPPIWGHSGPIQASSRTYWKIKKPAFLEGRWYTGRKNRQIWAELAVHVGYHLQKGWFFYFLICTRWSLNGSQMTPDRWRFMFFFFAEAYLPMTCVLTFSFLSNIGSLFIYMQTIQHSQQVLLCTYHHRFYSTLHKKSTTNIQLIAQYKQNNIRPQQQSCVYDLWLQLMSTYR